jgi:glyoxylase-like metal-dependent hydrolase (beta-lactamase superfamily II)
MAEAGLIVHQLEVGLMQNFVYLIGDPKTREAVVVDPAWEVDVILRKAAEAGLKLTGALVTHYHFDHTNGVEDLLHKIDVPVYVNRRDVPYLDFKHSNVVPVESGHKVRAGSVEIECVHTPGHTPGSQCFRARDRLVSGDTLFIGACGRTDLPGGNAEELYASLHRLAKLPDATVLLPGHNYADIPQTTMGEERKTNPYLLCDSLQNFLRFRTGVY